MLFSVGYLQNFAQNFVVCPGAVIESHRRYQRQKIAFAIMDRDKKVGKKVYIQPPAWDKENEEPEGGRLLLQPSRTTDVQEPFMGVKVRRRTSMYRQYQGDYLNVAANQQIAKLLEKQGDRQVLFADSVVKVKQSNQIKRRVLLITDVAAYILNAQWGNLKRRIALQSIEKVCLSELSDNFFALIVPSEYDTLLASTRKTEIVTVLVEATKKIMNNPLEVVFSNRFEYYIGSNSMREVQFELIDGGVKTRIVQK